MAHRGLAVLVSALVLGLAHEASAQVTINPTGGNNAADGLRIVVGPTGQYQIYRNGLAQTYHPAYEPPHPNNGNSIFVAKGAHLIGSEGAVYGSVIDEQWGAMSQSAVSGTGMVGDPYEVTTVLSSTVGVTLTYVTRYVAPDNFFDIDVDVDVDAGNTDVIKVYHGIDSFFSGSDTGPAYTQTDGMGVIRVLGVGPAVDGSYSAFVDIGDQFDHYFSGFWFTMFMGIDNGGDMIDLLDANPMIDNGFGVQWTLGAFAGTEALDWRIQFSDLPIVIPTDFDGDGVDDAEDIAPMNPFLCRDVDGDSCDDCVNTGADGSGGDVANDGLDTDGDGQCDVSDLELDGDGVINVFDDDPLNPFVCADEENMGVGDGCDDCAVTGADGSGGDVNNDGPDMDSDGNCDATDMDNDNDGVNDAVDNDPANPNVCLDTDMDTCDDCTLTGADNSGGDPTNDGTDTDNDGQCDAGDTDDDNDGVLDMIDDDPLNPFVCLDTDMDGCDDCTLTGANGSGGDPANDGVDIDMDGICDLADQDSDNDGVDDMQDLAPLDPNVCLDLDMDMCDDCTNTGANGSGGDVGNDGADADADGLCDVGDPDDDNDGVADMMDSDPFNPNVCLDSDADTCDDCTNTGANGSGGDVADDGPDSDGDGICDAGDMDIDNDGVIDTNDSDPVDPNVCLDSDADTCDDCTNTGANGSGGDVANDGLDSDSDGLCDAGDTDDDNDGVIDTDDIAPLDPNACLDSDADTCDDCTNTGANGSGGDPSMDGLDSDLDGQCNISDIDDDNDGIPDDIDGPGDTDDDGLPDALDLDSDADGIYDLVEAGHDGVDSNRDGRLDGAVGGNGLADELETAPDSGVIDYDSNAATDDAPANSDGAGQPDFQDVDSDGDMILDIHEAGDDDPVTPVVDTDEDGTPDYIDDDSDADTLLDIEEAGDDQPLTEPIDTDEDGAPNFQDVDSDNDTVEDGIDNCVLVPNTNQADSDNNGIGDACENDADNDSWSDTVDNCPFIPNTGQEDLDGDGLGDVCDDDADGDGYADTLGFAGGGCAATPSNSSIISWLVFGCLLSLYRRRRRRIVQHV